MDFVDALRVLGRRWLVLVIGCVLMLAGAGAVIWVVPTTYQATGQLVLLLPAEASGADGPTNPYLNLAPGLTLAGSLVASSLTTKEAERILADGGYTAEYAIGLDPTSGPVLEISAKSSDAILAVRTRDEVMRRLQEELLRIQVEQEAPKRQLIVARPNSVPLVAEPLPGSKIRGLAVIGGLGGILTLLIAFAVDRRKRATAASVPVPSEASSNTASAHSEESAAVLMAAGDTVVDIQGPHDSASDESTSAAPSVPVPSEASSNTASAHSEESAAVLMAAGDTVDDIQGPHDSASDQSTSAAPVVQHRANGPIETQRGSDDKENQPLTVRRAG